MILNVTVIVFLATVCEVHPHSYIYRSILLFLRPFISINTITIAQQFEGSSYQSIPSQVHGSTAYSLEYPADPNKIPTTPKSAAELQQSLPLTEQQPSRGFQDHGGHSMGEYGKTCGAAMKNKATESFAVCIPRKRRWLSLWEQFDATGWSTNAGRVFQGAELGLVLTLMMCGSSQD